MVEIVPSIIATDLAEVRRKIEVVEGHTEWVHIDIVDGKFASPETWPYSNGGVFDAPKLQDIDTSVKIELHLMTENPEDDLDEWLDTQAQRILIHQEASVDPHQALSLLSMSKVEKGIVLNMESSIDLLSEYYDGLDLIQLMSIAHIGGYGAKFEERVLAKIEQVKNDYPKIPLQLDGGMNETTIKQVVSAGADRVVVGSAIFRSDNPIEVLQKLQNL